MSVMTERLSRAPPTKRPTVFQDGCGMCRIHASTVRTSALNYMLEWRWAVEHEPCEAEGSNFAPLNRLVWIKGNAACDDADPSPAVAFVLEPTKEVFGQGSHAPAKAKSICCFQRRPLSSNSFVMQRLSP